VAIIRPGPIQGNAVHPYLSRRQRKEKVTYLHPSLEPILKETLGVVIYQEQVIQVAMAIAGFSPGQADSLRRAMSRKRSREAMEKLREGFMDGACRNGIDEKVASIAFQQIASFAEFGFCKAHAAALAETTYRSAWLKLYYPCEYYCALLNCQPMGFYSPEVIVNHAKQKGSGTACGHQSRGPGAPWPETDQLGSTCEGHDKACKDRRGEQGLYTSLDDFYARTRLDREAENLIGQGLIFSVPRRQPCGG
jgi:error-prone DNA polymerase